MEINFEEGFQSKEKAKEVVAQIQKVISDLEEASRTLLAKCNEQKDQINDLVELNQSSTLANVNLADTIKAIHMELNSKMELVSQDKGLTTLTKDLGKWVVSSSSIKLGVLSKAFEDEKNEEN